MNEMSIRESHRDLALCDLTSVIRVGRPYSRPLQPRLHGFRMVRCSALALIIR